MIFNVGDPSRRGGFQGGPLILPLNKWTLLIFSKCQDNMIVFRMFFNADKFIRNFKQFKTSAKRRHLEFGIFYEHEVLYVTLTEEFLFDCLS